jgi:hypothetical protein
MKRKKLKPRPKRLALRLPEGIHDELHRIAALLGSDVTGIINMMVRDMLPTYRAKAAQLDALEEQWRKLMQTSPMLRWLATKPIPTIQETPDAQEE